MLFCVVGFLCSKTAQIMQYKTIGSVRSDVEKLVEKVKINMRMTRSSTAFYLKKCIKFYGRRRSLVLNSCIGYWIYAQH